MRKRSGEKEEKEHKQFHKIMEVIRQDPQKGLEMFREVYGKIIQTTAEVICRFSDKAGEVIDDVFVRIWEYAKTEKEVDNPEGWVYTVTANTAKIAMRRRYVLPLSEDIAATEDLIQAVIDEQSFYWLLEDLSEAEKAVMIHKFVANETFQEIASESDKPLTTITSTYYRAFDKVKRKLEEELKKI